VGDTTTYASGRRVYRDINSPEFHIKRIQGSTFPRGLLIIISIRKNQAVNPFTTAAKIFSYQAEIFRTASVSDKHRKFILTVISG
jgi:hypothetical protein